MLIQVKGQAAFSLNVKTANIFKGEQTELRLEFDADKKANGL
jgi:hypothetical protein